MPYGSAFHFAAEEYLLLEGIENPFHCMLYVEFKVETGREWLTKRTCRGYKELARAGIEVLKVVTYKDPKSYMLRAIDRTHQWIQETNEGKPAWLNLKAKRLYHECECQQRKKLSVLVVNA